MTDAPEPRVDKDGVPWCNHECRFYKGALGTNACERPIHCHGYQRGQMCRPALIASAAEAAALRTTRDELESAVLRLTEKVARLEAENRAIHDALRVANALLSGGAKA
jgi:hypothetical protein